MDIQKKKKKTQKYYQKWRQRNVWSCLKGELQGVQNVLKIGQLHTEIQKLENDRCIKFYVPSIASRMPIETRDMVYIYVTISASIFLLIAKGELKLKIFKLSGRVARFEKKTIEYLMHVYYKTHFLYLQKKKENQISRGQKIDICRFRSRQFVRIFILK